MLHASDVTNIAGFSYHALDRLIRGGVVTPSINVGSGKGSRRLFTSRDVLALRIARELREIGVEENILRAVVVFFQKKKSLTVKQLAHSFLVLEGGKISLVPDGELHRLGHLKGPAHVLPLSPVARDLEHVLDPGPKEAAR